MYCIIVGGWNNNPTVVHFKAAFRKLITRCGVAADRGSTGNVTAQTNMEMVQLSTYVPPAISDSPDVCHDSLVTSTQLLKSYNSVVGNILVYISGWVVRKLLQKVTCEQCRLSCVSTHGSIKYTEYCVFTRQMVLLHV